MSSPVTIIVLAAGPASRFGGRTLAQSPDGSGEAGAVLGATLRNAIASGLPVLVVTTADLAPLVHQQIMCSRSFGSDVTELSDLVEVVSGFAVRVARRLREQDSVAGAVHVFIRTSPYRAKDRQHAPSATDPSFGTTQSAPKRMATSQRAQPGQHLRVGGRGEAARLQRASLGGEPQPPPNDARRQDGSERDCGRMRHRPSLRGGSMKRPAFSMSVSPKDIQNARVVGLVLHIREQFVKLGP